VAEPVNGALLGLEGAFWTAEGIGASTLGLYENREEII
jgi:hypothetical protein